MIPHSLPHTHPLAILVQLASGLKRLSSEASAHKAAAAAAAAASETADN